jgi:hypothetical protein
VAASWNDVEHEQTDVQIQVTVSVALALKALLPGLLQLVDEASARGPEDRERRRQTRVALEALMAGLRESIRHFDVPEGCARS